MDVSVTHVSRIRIHVVCDLCRTCDGIYSFAATGLAGEEAGAPGPAIRLAAPSPYRAGGAIRFALPAPGRARITLYDVRGRWVAVLLDESLPAGPGTVRWDGRDRTGAGAPSGVYLWRFTAGDRSATGKMVFVR